MRNQQFKGFIQCLGLLCLAVALSPAWAQKRVALLIGNSNYQFEKALPNPVRDIELLEQALKKLGFAVDKLENQDKRGMELGINRFVNKTAGADTALLFYAGHGTQSSKGGRSYLLPVNAKVDDDETLEADGVSAEDIASKLKRSSNPAKLRLVILDACRSRKNTRGGDRGLARPQISDNFTLVAYSTQDGKTADDGNGLHSPYAQALAKHLPRMAKEPVRLVFEGAAGEVRKNTKNQQDPQTYGNLESLIGLDGVQVASLVAEPVDAAKTAWDAAQRANTAAAYRAFLGEYGSSSYAGAARVALAGVAPVEPPPKPPSPAPVQPPPTPVPAVPTHAVMDGRYEILPGGAEVKDLQTRLIWQRCAVGQRWTGESCAGEVKRFKLDEAQQQAGNSWRMPTIRELAGLILCSSGKMKGSNNVMDGGAPIKILCDGDYTRPTINTMAFPNTPQAGFCSSSVFDDYSAWYVYFVNGYVSSSNRDSAFAVRLVRASQ